MCACRSGKPRWVTSSQEESSEGGETPTSRRHQVIDYHDLHKVRGITDLRRAIIAAERNNSLPSLVDEARCVPHPGRPVLP